MMKNGLIYGFYVRFNDNSAVNFWPPCRPCVAMTSTSSHVRLLLQSDKDRLVYTASGDYKYISPPFAGIQPQRWHDWRTN